MGKPKKKKQQPKTNAHNNIYTNFPERRMIYENTFVNSLEVSRQSFNDVSVYNEGYGAYSWFKPSKYTSNFSGKYTSGYSANYASNYSNNYVSSYSGSFRSSGKSFRKKSRRKTPSRTPSPVLGSEEYMVRKVQKTSAIIMKQLLNPNEKIEDICQKETSNKNEEDVDNAFNKNVSSLEKITETDSNKSKHKKVTVYNIEEIHKKIMNHITNLNDGKKRNLINSKSSGYDTVIQQIQKQKRLEVSRALRDVCSQSKQIQESSDFINSIIPDIGIKIEDLPRDIIEELTNTLNCDFERLSYRQDDNADGNINEATLIDTHSAENCVTHNSSKGEPQQIENSGVGEFISVPKVTTDAVISEGEITKNYNADSGEQNEKHIEAASSEELLHMETYIKPEVIDVDSFSENSIDIGINDNFDTNSDENSKSNVKYIKPDIIDEPSSSQFSSEGSTNENTLTENINSNNNETNEIDAITIRIEDLKNEIDYTEIERPSENISLNQTTCDTGQNINCINIEPQVQNNSIPTIAREIHNEISGDDTERVETGITKELDKTFNQKCVSSQTDIIGMGLPEIFVDLFLGISFKQPPESISEAIDRMIKIDQCILKLTEYRQSLFTNFRVNKSNTSKKLSKKKSQTSASTIGGKRNKKTPAKKGKKCGNSERTKKISAPKRKAGIRENGSNKKRKLESAPEGKNTDRCETNTAVQDHDIEDTNSLIKSEESVEINNVRDISFPECETVLNSQLNSSQFSTRQNLLEFQEVQEKMLVIKVVEDKLVTATESGKVFFCSLEDGHYTNVLDVSKLPLTSLLFTKIDQTKIHMYVGSYELVLKIYNFHNQELLKTIKIDDSIECMESSWGYIFIGCRSGFMLRYSLKKQMMEYEDKFFDDGILVLKAAQEGARRILLIGSRNSPVYIRDAMTGLYMRTMENTTISPTVHSLIIEKNLVYCGTINHDILVYSFYDGKLIHTHKPTTVSHTVGISCMKIVKNLLFGCCHSGNIYVYDVNKNVCIDSIKGPGGIILSMEILENQVIVGTSLFKFKSIPIPHHILKLKQ